jgi:hypothetical protein
MITRWIENVDSGCGSDGDTWPLCLPRHLYNGEIIAVLEAVHALVLLCIICQVFIQDI